MTANLPPAPVLIEAARAAMNEASAHKRNPVKAANRALDRWKPAIDQPTDTAGAAAFLGYKNPATVTRMRAPDRTRADGTPEWPAPDHRYGRSDVWRYRTIVLSRAAAPGRGHPGAPRSHGRLVRTAR